MCSYGSKSLDSLTAHICKNHRSDSRFNVYCKSCFRSYSKWESYRKHVQRGCKVMPCSTVDVASSSSFQPESDLGIDFGPSLDLSRTDIDTLTPVSDKWHKATFILSIKEKHILSQVAIDHVLSTKKLFVSALCSKMFVMICLRMCLLK